MKSIIRLLRPAQWVKNGLVFVPIFFARTLFNTEAFTLTLITFIGFCAAASIVYVLNDVVDAPADRLHPVKKHRPIASGAVSHTTAGVIAALLVVFLGYITYVYIPSLWWIFSLYIVLNILYSLWFKHAPVIDLVIVSFFYFLRVEAGGYATHTPISSWLILCTIFVSLFIIVAKRRAEMSHENQRKVLAYYTDTYLDHLLTMCGAITLVSYGIYTVLGQVPQYAVYSNFFLITGLFRYLHLSYTSSHTERPEKVVMDSMIISSFLMWLIFMIVIFYR
jgi:decaprenyl-phosphate phosphoribosyltransferase